MIEVDPEFRTVLLRVVSIGTIVMTVGAVGLYYAFRAFGTTDKRGSEVRAVALIVGVIAIVMIGSVVILMFSFTRR